jgi:hypothetical protein
VSETPPPVTSQRIGATPLQVGGIVLAACVFANVAFKFLADQYFSERIKIYGAESAAHIAQVKLNFAVFSLALGIGAVVVALSPRIIGHLIAGVAALASLAGGVAAMTHDMTPVLPASLLLLGLVMTVLVWRSLLNERAPWSFLIGMTSVMAAVLLFGATKVRNVLDVGLWTALIIPGLLAVATVALAMIRDDYREA